jgi:hypothetical protein
MLLLRRCLVIAVTMFFIALFSAFAWAETSRHFKFEEPGSFVCAPDTVLADRDAVKKRGIR